MTEASSPSSTTTPLLSSSSSSTTATAPSSSAAPSASTDQAFHPVILYDGVCNLCAGIVKFVIRRDPDSLFRFCALQSEAALPFLAKYNISEEDAMKSFVVIDRDSRTGKEVALRRSTAALAIASHLPSPWSWARHFLLVPTCIRDLVYNCVSSNRYSLFGKSEECLMPTADVRARFLDWAPAAKTKKKQADSSGSDAGGGGAGGGAAGVGLARRGKESAVAASQEHESAQLLTSSSREKDD